ncbi:ribosomal protein S18 [Phycomyces blakesleeanus]|uniref:Small ribosomal subunit protein bS18m n=2 Tax=Phycomyces blakesleeanus TaxID=4837 RepID=A0A162NH92_PHYB8|nr:hypothetical protein PHYBLDRAFT_78303 [Phycomyces blakesleeanus NRRL 1555(-)]OAD69634.1 hypothetical protein PHYBLDRAFT_78303 [Phycomyces blakesleeanus NRRL 1555(-)]|eukprot:XP_018287674.1 hypothetical protein PHYBLDRAFT_78303 [Phycomyces blakesleeanus NRRL 1555(-)]
MFAQVRTLSTLSGVMRTPIVRALPLTHRSMTTAASNSQSKPERTIEKKTLALLEDSIKKEKSRPVVEAVQRYQKIHRVGDTYHPEDLNDTRYQESLRQRRGRPVTPAVDPFDALGLDPLHEYKNFRLLSHFVSDMGKILPRTQTGVSAKNQRKLAHAVKRARAMGLMSCTSKYVSPMQYWKNTY